MKNKKRAVKYKAIIFDLGGVLSITRHRGEETRVHKLVAKSLGLSVDLYFDSIDEVYAKAISGEVSKSQALKIMSRNLNTNPKNLERIYAWAYRKNFTRDKSMLRTALRLKRMGYKIAIISDIWQVAADALIDGYYSKIFDIIVTSCDVGSRKTDKKIFQVTLKKLKVKPSEAIFTDNQKWNIPAPKKLGITSFQYKNKKQFIQKLKKLKVI